jgi:uridine kinase
MDDYFRTRGSFDPPKNPDGSLDLESPECLDMPLLSEHFDLLSRGKRVYLPKFDFSRQMRIMEPSNSIMLQKDELAIFEGIHALNDDITSRHPKAFKLYVSARSGFVSAGEEIFKGTWTRLVRRTVRDHLFRGADAATTLKMWANVRVGEKKYISPYKGRADIMLDSSSQCEICVMGDMACGLFDEIPEGTERFGELKRIRPALDKFSRIDPALLGTDSLLREFLGGGSYEY